MSERETKVRSNWGEAVRDYVAERFDLLPAGALMQVAAAMGEGARKYGPDNYLKGMPSEICLNHAVRHVYLHLAGDVDEEHLSHAAANLLMAMAIIEHGSDL